MATFSHLFGPIENQIAEFEKRIEVDGLEFCAALFEDAEIKVMAAKYAYYILGTSHLSDDAYDLIEHSWYVMGRALGDIDADETSPCVGWDSGQRSATKGRDLAHKLRKK